MHETDRSSHRSHRALGQSHGGPAGPPRCRISTSSRSTSATEARLGGVARRADSRPHRGGDAVERRRPRRARRRDVRAAPPEDAAAEVARARASGGRRLRALFRAACARQRIVRVRVRDERILGVRKEALSRALRGRRSRASTPRQASLRRRRLDLAASALRDDGGSGVLRFIHAISVIESSSVIRHPS